MKVAETFLHNGNVDNLNDDNYWHGYGLKPLPKYKFGFIAKTGTRSYVLYDQFGNIISTMTAAETIFKYILPMPSVGKILIATQSSSHLWNIEIFNAKTGIKLWSIVATDTAGFTIDVFENGDIVTLGRTSRDIKIYDHNGILKETILDIAVDITAVINLAVNTKRKVIALTTGTVANIYDKSTISSKFPRVSVASAGGQYFGELSVNGNIIHKVNSSLSALRIHKVDYANNTDLGSIQVALNKTNYYNGYLRSIGNKVYILRQYSGAGLNELVEVDETTLATNVISLPSNVTINDIDDKYIYASNGSNFYVYNRNTQELLLTIPSTYTSKGMWTSKGNYPNFYKYW